jgi:hypothetical protein
LEEEPAPEAVEFGQRPDKDQMGIFLYETITTIMKSFYVYIVLMTGILTVSRAQNIYSGGRGDGFAFEQAGFGIYAGGSSSGFAFSSVGAPGNEVPLPITLLNFTAQPQGPQVLLRWQTAMENNNDHFEVERSADAVTFQFLASVASYGNSTTKQSYQAIDPSPYRAFNYYRLRQVDKDGIANYSKIVSVDISTSETGFSIQVRPNPARQAVTIDLVSPRNISAMVSLYNSEGKLINRRFYPLVAGLNQLTWDISHLSAGIYYCKAENTGLPAISFMKE